MESTNLSIFAPVASAGNLSSTFTVSTESIKVWGIVVYTIDNVVNDISMESADGSEIYLQFESVTRSTRVINLKFLAENGLRFRLLSGANPSRTGIIVFHSQVGA